MTKDLPPLQGPDLEFRTLFWAARKEHFSLKGKDNRGGAAHLSALAFAHKHGWQWAATLVEASRLSISEDPAQALQLLEKRDEFIPPAHVSLGDYLAGVAFHRKGDLDAAIAAFRSALARQSFDRPGNAWNRIGSALTEKGKLDEAIEAYHKALSSPGYETPGNAWNNLGVALRQKGQLDEAIEAHHKALSSPDYETPGNAWNNLGIALRQKGQLDEAIEAYHKALSSPGNETPGSAWNNLGVALRQKGQLDEAIEAYRKALSSPGYETPGKACNNLGVALRQKGQLDEAIEAYKKALSSPGYETPGKAWNNLGVALTQKGQLDEAIEAYKKALSSPGYETSGKTLCNLGECYADRSRFSEAKEAFQKALSAPDPTGKNHRSARLQLAMLEGKLKPKALTPEDRALTGKDAAETPADNLEDKIVQKLLKAGDTQYEKYLEQKDSERDDTLSILRGWSSAVTLLEGSQRLWRGGGYFIKWKGHGLVLDPGFDFLREFHDAHFHGREISAVLVSHNHPDHNDDLKSIDDLRYELYSRLAATAPNPARPYVLLWDEDTNGATKFAVEEPQHHLTPIVLPSGYPQPVDFSSGAYAVTLPLRVIPFRVKHSKDVPHAMGMVLELLDGVQVATRIGYTGDTKFFRELSTHVQNCDVILAHMSQPSRDELEDPEKFKKDHLGYRGMIRLLDECQPKLALIGEFWAGLVDLRIDLVKGLRLRSKCKRILPASLGMHLRLPNLQVECTNCGTPSSPEGLQVAPPAQQFGPLSYLCAGCRL